MGRGHQQSGVVWISGEDLRQVAVAVELAKRRSVLDMATLGGRVHALVLQADNRSSATHSTFQLQAKMPYPSVDTLQQALTRDVFHYARDAKKAAGRALGTVVEVITFHVIKAWGLERHTAIERRLPEYGNPEITHNVEFSLHPSKRVGSVQFEAGETPITTKKILRRIGITSLLDREPKATQLLSSNRILRNACTLYEDNDHLVVAHLEVIPSSDTFVVTVHDLLSHPFAAIECKRVGVEDGMKKGPQTIEKAKQGAYVARALSSVQRVRTSSGELYGVVQTEGGKLRYKPYRQLVSDIINAENTLLLKDFVLTVGVVSNHGNWFATDNQSKELKVLAQSYDWLLFLTDDGIAQFAHDMLLAPHGHRKAVREAFVNSYGKGMRRNVFTKVQMSLDADLALQSYFREKARAIDDWFNVVSPRGGHLIGLRRELETLASKDWEVLR